MTIVTLWTATRNANPKRFNNSKSLIWATPEKALLAEYGWCFWELQVKLPPEEKGDYLYTGQKMARGQSWGYNPGFEDVGAYVFKAGNIVSRKRVLSRLTLVAEQNDKLLKNLLKENKDLKKKLAALQHKRKLNSKVKEKVAAIAVAAFSFTTIAATITVAINNISALQERRDVQEQRVPESNSSNCSIEQFDGGDC